MATQQTATVYITNSTDGHAWIQLYHQNSSNGVESRRWYALPGEKAGPLTVHFETGIDVLLVLDYWWVNLEVIDGSTPGQYVSGGSVFDPGWKECQLEHEDAGQTLNFSVSNTIFNINEDSGPCSTAMDYVGPYCAITNVFVLMLENHSFDNIFACSGIPGIVAANATDHNDYGGKSYHVTCGAPLSMPTDPGHEFTDTVEQLCGAGKAYPTGGPYPPIDNSGFAANYATTTTESPKPPPLAEVGDIMACFDTKTQLPVMYQLATEFAICDHWFSSLPGPTWPNRFFVHGASSAGLDHSPSGEEVFLWETVDGFEYPNGSIYDAMNANNIPWRIYNDDWDRFSDDPKNYGGQIPQVTSLKGITILKANSLDHFASDLQDPYPYKYTFIEPDYGDLINSTYEGGSSEHPMDDVYGAEGLVKSVYEAIRNSPLWATSLLVITYDEHGGFYDSIAPGPATAPNDGSGPDLNKYDFKFDRYGVRVPAIIVSPRILKGTVDHTVYDHTSVPATLEKLFGMDNLTDRDKNANNLISLLSLATPRVDCPSTLADAPLAMKAIKPALTDEQKTTKDLEPLPETEGNLRGFLHTVLKADYEARGSTPEARVAAEARRQQVHTRGEARIYVNEVMNRVYAVKGPNK